MIYAWLCTILLSISLTLHVSAVDYRVTNDEENAPGGIRFNDEIGIPYTKEILGKINNFVWSTVFQQNSPEERKPITSIALYIKDVEGSKSTTWGKSNINVSGLYLAEYVGDVKREFTTIIYHEVTHILHWDAEGKCPEKLLEGIAEYSLLKANYSLQNFAKPGDGKKWDDGFDITARFLEYCDSLAPGFVAKLNNKMKKTYDVSYFKELTGKPVEQLWNDYKAKYGKKQNNR